MYSQNLWLKFEWHSYLRMCVCKQEFRRSNSWLNGSAVVVIHLRWLQFQLISWLFFINVHQDPLILNGAVWYLIFLRLFFYNYLSSIIFMSEGTLGVIIFPNAYDLTRGFDAWEIDKILFRLGFSEKISSFGLILLSYFLPFFLIT